MLQKTSEGARAHIVDPDTPSGDALNLKFVMLSVPPFAIDG